MPVEIKTLPLVAAHRPSSQINMNQHFGPGSGGGSAGGGGGGGGYYGSAMLPVSSGTNVVFIFHISPLVNVAPFDHRVSATLRFLGAIRSLIPGLLGCRCDFE